MDVDRDVRIACVLAIIVILGGCDDPVRSEHPETTPLEIEAVAGGSVTITISSDIFHDNITGVEPPAFAEVTDITGPRTTIYCKRAGKGDLIIRWNDRAPNADPSGVMIRHVSTLTLYCRHQQGGGK